MSTSVIIPAYNQGRYLSAAIRSVLEQTLQDFEIIVVDDGSSDDTPAVAQAFDEPRVRYIYQENRGLSAARNTGIRQAQGRYLSYLDSDDWFLPRKLELIPVIDLHTGFPYSKLDADWDFVGQRNQAGRFPTFVGVDAKLQYPFDFRFRGRHFQFRAGLKVYNILNHFNPRDVQQYGDSRQFGVFYNSVGRLYRLEGEFDF